MSARDIARALAGAEVRPRCGNYLVRCPSHDDASPSLSLRDGERGLLLHCFAGCAASDVFVAIRRIDRGLLHPGATAPESAKGSGEYERRQRERAVWLWSRRVPIVGSIAERYLRGVRGIACPLPATLGFLPAYRDHL